jgi:hypothetical protein
LESGTVYSISDVAKMGRELDIFDLLQENAGICKRYNYLELLYKFRSKLVHEYRFPSTFNDRNDEYEISPYYFHMTDLGLNEKNEVVEDSRWKLIFPYRFVRTLILNSLDEYLGECYRNRVDPFQTYKQYDYWYME